MSRVRRILVPPHAFAEARKLVDDSKLNIPVEVVSGFG